MGELATAVEDLPRYVKDGYTLVTSQMTHKLDALVKENRLLREELREERRRARRTGNGDDPNSGRL